jgi:autotransporter-associated beta strand protein
VSSGSGIIDVSANFTLNTKRGITLSGNGIIDVNASRTLTYGGIITGSNGLTKSSAGTLSLSGINTYTGGTTISLGTIILDGVNRLYEFGDVTFANAAAILNLDGNDNDIARIIGGGSSSQIQLGGGDLVLNMYGNSTYNGKITGSGNLTINKHGHLSLSNTTHDYTGTTTINNGGLNATATNVLPSGTVVTINNSGTLWVSGAYSNTIAGLISSSANSRVRIHNWDSVLVVNTSSNTTFAGVIIGSGKLTKSGSGNLTLSGANTHRYTLINAGKIILGAAGVLHDAGVVQLANISGATLDLNGNNENIGLLFGGGSSGGNLVLGSGNLTVDNRAATGLSHNSTYAGVISGSGNLIKTGTGTLTLTGANTYTGTTTISNGEVTLSGSGDLSNDTAITVENGATMNVAKSIKVGSIAGAGKIIINESINTIFKAGIDDTSTAYTGVMSGNGQFYKEGSGTLTISGTHDIYNGYTVAGGVLRLGAAGVINDMAWIDLKDTSGVSLNLNNNNEIIGTLIGGGSSGGNITLGSGNLGINQIYRLIGGGNNSENSTYGGVISGSGSLIKTGYGTITFTGANTFTGGTTINAGGIRVDVNNALPNGRALTVANNSHFKIMNDRTQNIGQFAASSNTKILLMFSSILNLNLSSDSNVSATINAAGSNSGSKGKLRKTGSGTLTISGSSNVTVENF